ncbi:MAG: PF20097 family protein [Pirellulaceae bacterium]
MPDHITPSPYAPPTEMTSPTEMRCPSCQERMDDGELMSGSTIRWRSNSVGAIKSLFTGGTKLGETKSGLGYRLAAYHCHTCRIVMVKQ